MCFLLVLCMCFVMGTPPSFCLQAFIEGIILVMLVLSFSLSFLQGFRNTLQLTCFEKFGLKEHLAVVVLSLFPFSSLRCAAQLWALSIPPQTIWAFGLGWIGKRIVSSD